MRLHRKEVGTTLRDSTTQELETKATALLTAQALKKLGAGYSLFGDIQVSVKQASVTSTPPPLVFLSFTSSGTWIYALSHQSQQQIKQIIAGKTKQAALHELFLLPGIERATIRFSGITDDTKLPKNMKYIYITLLVM
jgi:hypothetical protein